MDEKPLTMAEVYADAFAAGRAAERAEIVADLKARAERRYQQGRQESVPQDQDGADPLFRFAMASECESIADSIERRATPNVTEPTQC